MDMARTFHKNDNVYRIRASRYIDNKFVVSWLRRIIGREPLNATWTVFWFEAAEYDPDIAKTIVEIIESNDKYFNKWTVEATTVVWI